ncbi:MAG: hydantoinase B/oxoprolinase family protein [Gemmatimonadetes bacterium]|uniref:Hydantoinase B/oxoprolinase family protein n=1 Tax=Candidatus Kutchimonas denitrificans TaxID=3056748 RepID=A0AAE4ZAT2_9BACT|nr:hydantoinase B/oxoprolinase family protein [Gemmatimonadota bacterium]NIR74696.1 hydantoinase B/oxoprolinase family protein [Candidatus Kutchimonas denitrificans]NIS01446.1 hydantoinase B/oxoprolinase family protein [Gemmatimonadota bacterium]NIT67187.1 hydantoinase B/oxoprolinase family protein [Gemmatimonadota bacterium]NIU52361.1 hydantoinase B/oxoprolinase family protein [Gemmatimonadota bacterium]
MQTLPPGGPNHLDAIRLEVYRSLLQAIAEEMGAALRRSAYSPNIKERRDYSCAICDARARPVALGDHMPVHLGAIPRSVQAALAALELGDGDVALLNDPFHGGTHLPDLTAVRGVWIGPEAELLGYVASRAHHADVGGAAPGSMPLSREIFQEGVRIPPVKLVRGGAIDRDVWRMILANVRTPGEREGDLHAQLAALDVGVRRLRELAERRSPGELRIAFDELASYADRLLRRVIERIPDGRYVAEDFLDDDGVTENAVRIAVAIEVEGDEIDLDFEGSAGQRDGNVNAVAAITESAVRYALRCVAEAVLGTSLPAGGADMAAVRLRIPERSVVNAQPPAAVAAGNVETSQRIVDVVFAALGQALPDLVPACSSGTMNNFTMGGLDPESGEPFAYYETVAGGMGANRARDGLAGVHTHMTNSLNTPVEALEHAIPVHVRHYSLRARTGGEGLRRGGDGLRRDVELLVPARVTVLSERRRYAPGGARGGAAGAAGENWLIHDGEPRRLAGKFTEDVAAGDVISIRTPGGGGWGNAGS